MGNIYAKGKKICLTLLDIDNKSIIDDGSNEIIAKIVTAQGIIGFVYLNLNPSFNTVQIINI